MLLVLISRGASNKYAQHVFLWRNKKKILTWYQLITWPMSIEGDLKKQVGSVLKNLLYVVDKKRTSAYRL